MVARDGVVGLPAADLDQLPEAGRFTALRNLLYGVEWWVFGGVRAVHLVALGAGLDVRAGGPRPTPTPIDDVGPGYRDRVTAK